MSFSPTKLQKLSSEHKIKLLTKLLARLESSLGSEQGIEEIVQDLSTIAQSMDGIGDPALRQCLEKVLAASDSYVILEALSSYHGLSPRKDGQIHIRKLDGSPTPDPLRLHKAGQVVLILDNLRSVFNVGSIFRTAECLGISKIILCGITPSPQHPNMDKTAMGTHKLVAWESYPDTSKVLKNLHHQGYASYALETAEPAQDLYKSQLSLPLALVVGNESLGISNQVLQNCQNLLFIPVMGHKNSLNVGVATALALYHIICSV